MTRHDEEFERFLSDFDDLPDDEASELANIALQLKADQAPLDEVGDAFFARMEQQIANQIAVTPIPGQQAARKLKGGKAGFWRRLFSVPGLLAIASAAVVALAVWVLVQPPAPGTGTIDIVWVNGDAGSDATGPQHPEPDDVQNGLGIVVDDELWNDADGFFNGSVASLDEEYASLLLDGIDDSLFGRGDIDEDRFDPLDGGYGGGVWGDLGGLSADELNALDAILDG